MKLSKIMTALETLAPLHLAEPWDQVGLHVGDPSQTIRRAMLCIDLTPAVLEEAIQQRIQLIVAYHPPIFKPLARLTSADLKQRLILQAARKGIAIYSPHTALDAAQGGVNDWLASGLGEGQINVIQQAEAAGERRFKLATFVPEDSADKLRQAMCQAGAGQIGEYESCSFGCQGQGTFRGSESTSPTVGRAGRFERVPELRLELPVPASALADVVTALRQTHPYEEPAFDIYPLQAVSDGKTGQGRVVILNKPVSFATLIKRIKTHLGVKTLEVAAPSGSKRIQRIGLCAGAGGSLLESAGQIDAFLTGEMRHHDTLSAVNRGVAILLAGHTQTERPYLPIYKRRITAQLGSAVQWSISRADRPPSQLR